MDYLPTLGEKWAHSRGNGLVNLPYMEHLGKVMFALVSCEADRFDVATQLLELPHRLQFKFNDMRGGQVVAILKMLQNRFLFTKSL